MAYFNEALLKCKKNILKCNIFFCNNGTQQTEYKKAKTSDFFLSKVKLTNFVIHICMLKIYF